MPVDRIRLPVFMCAIGVVCGAGIAAAEVRIEAYRGETWGVGRIEIKPSANHASTAAEDDRFAVTEQSGRILYPVVGAMPVQKLLRQFLPINLPSKLKLYFLFRGDAPLELEIYAPTLSEVTVNPQVNVHRYRELLKEWWQAYAKMYEQIHRSAEYPLVVQNYLTATWARRLDKPMPAPPGLLFRQRGAGGSLFPQLFADETYRASVERNLLLGQLGVREPLTEPLPEVAPTTIDWPEPPVDTEVEPISMVVPEECYYLRFGNFKNYLWFRDTLNRWRGDLANMVVMRSINRNIGPRIEEQLSLKESMLSRILGPTVINDIAIIGLDPFFRDGAAVGVLFEAKSNVVLKNGIRAQRREVLDSFPDATEENVNIGDHDVSFLSTADGQVRSYYAIAGQFHLVTNCRHLVERFYEAVGGIDPLGGSVAFRWTRVEMPLPRLDTLFGYFSTPFFDNLASSHYRIGLERRLRSVGEIRTLRMAQFAAVAEGRLVNTVGDLIDAGLLPKDFGYRTDGTTFVRAGHSFRDTVRGTPGRFLPIADIKLDSVSPAEVTRYRQFQNLVRKEVGQFVPLAVGLQRSQDANPDREKIRLDVRLERYSQTQLAGWANKLGPADSLGVAPIAGAVASGEIVLEPLRKPMHLFAGLLDFHTSLIVREGRAVPAGAYEQSIRGFVGAWPRLYLLDHIFGPPRNGYDANGYAQCQGIFGLLETWQRRIGDFFLFSFQKDVLEEVGPQLAMVPTERPAQIRLRVSDFSETQIATTVAGFGYMQARQTSASGSRFMNSLMNQLHVPCDEAREVAEQLVAGKFVCPLGGDYVVAEEPGGRPVWISTATVPENRFLLTIIPDDYELPLLRWFRGLSAEVTRNNDTLSLHADLLAELGQNSAPVQNNGSEEKEAWNFPSLEFLNPFGKLPAVEEADQNAAEDHNDVPVNKQPVPPPRQLPVPELLPVPKVGKSG